MSNDIMIFSKSILHIYNLLPYKIIGIAIMVMGALSKGPELKKPNEILIMEV